MATANRSISAFKARRALGTARDRLASSYARTTRSLRNTMDYSANHPGQISLIAFGAGIGVGMLLLAQTRGRRKHGGAAVAEAIGSVARQIFRR